MTYPRSKLIEPGQAGAFHCVTRCVRRAWLCGVDAYTGKCFDHRKCWVEQRIKQLGRIFAVGIYSYAVMSNHVHIVLGVVPRAAHDWSDEEVAERWLMLYPPRDANDVAVRHAGICADPVLLMTYRERLCDLSWFMKSLAEPIARRANDEDGCTGRFWEGRFKCQALLNEKAMLAACAYVDLNPIRAKVAKRVTTSLFTAVRERASVLKAHPSQASMRMLPIAGIASTIFPRITTADYIDLVDWTGRQWRDGKRGAIAADEPPALRRIGLDAAHWTMHVKGIGSGYWRVVGAVDELKAKAQAMGQRWLCGIGLARFVQG